MSELVNIAARLAFEAHNGQVRKYSSLPYITHPARVAGVVGHLGMSDIVVAAAWLHDVVEDSSLTVSDIGRFVGWDVSDLVRWLTTPKKGTTREDRRVIKRELLAKSPIEAKIIKLVDRADNLRDMDVADDFCDLYVEESRDLIKAAHDGTRFYRISGLQSAYASAYTALFTAIDELQAKRARLRRERAA